MSRGSGRNIGKEAKGARRGDRQETGTGSSAMAFAYTRARTGGARAAPENINRPVCDE